MWCLWDGWDGEAAQEGCSWLRSDVSPLKNANSTGHWEPCYTLLSLGLLSQEQSRSGIQSTAETIHNPEATWIARAKVLLPIFILLLLAVALSSLRSLLGTDTMMSLLFLPFCSSPPLQLMQAWVCWFIGGVWEQGEERAWSLQKKGKNRTWQLAVLAAHT